MADHVKKTSVPSGLEALLKEYPALRVDDSKGKVCCCLTGHEMPLKEDAVRSFVQGKKFLKAQQQREFDYNQYKPHLVPNTKKRLQHTLFCTLTLRTVTKRPADVERHVNGKRYQRALARWEKCQETGEKFKPRGIKKRGAESQRGEGDSASDTGSTKNIWDSDDEQNDDDDDDLDDLYPSGDFASSDEEDEDESDDEGSGANLKDSGGGDGGSSDSGSDLENTDGPAKANGHPPHKTMKRKKQQQQQPRGKKKRLN